jgi:hypothetical protein
MLRKASLVLIAGILAVAPAPAALAQVSAHTLGLPVCTIVVVQTTKDVDSATARAGEFFQFQTINAVTHANRIVIPSHTAGWGVISVANAAGAHGQAGTLLLDHNASALSKNGTSGNAPGYLGVIPGLGAAIGAFNYFHHGNNTTVPKGTIFAVFPSDDPATANCLEH